MFVLMISHDKLMISHDKIGHIFSLHVGALIFKPPNYSHIPQS